MPNQSAKSSHHLPHVANGLMWFRRDLRAFDNAALYHALKSCKQVHCVFVFDKTILDPLPRQDRRVEFIHESLVALDAELIFGHWSTLGRVHWPEHGVWGLDTGCIWGGRLSALRLDDGRLSGIACDEYRRPGAEQD